jgi:GNAT superfamily N-acetyltransferase
MLTYATNDPVTSQELNALFSAGSPEDGWPSWQRTPDSSDWQPVLDHSLAYITVRENGKLLGFVNVAWDGRDHAFLLDPRVHPDFRHRGIGSELVRHATDAAKTAGCECLHVDYDESLAPFYEACGFHPTPAGLISLT